MGTEGSVHNTAEKSPGNMTLITEETLYVRRDRKDQWTQYQCLNAARDQSVLG